MVASIFLDFNLPNAATWFYFSFLLAVTVFVKFDRLLTLRNWDVVTLYLMVPGLLLIQEAHALQSLVPAEQRDAYQRPRLEDDKRPPPEADQFLRRSQSLLAAGYIWLVVGSAYFFLRAVFDLGLEKRPSLLPNLTLPSLVWLGAAPVSVRNGGRRAADAGLAPAGRPGAGRPDQGAGRGDGRGRHPERHGRLGPGDQRPSGSSGPRPSPCTCQSSSPLS